MAFVTNRLTETSCFNLKNMKSHFFFFSFLISTVTILPLFFFFFLKRNLQLIVHHSFFSSSSSFFVCSKRWYFSQTRIGGGGTRGVGGDGWHWKLSINSACLDYFCLHSFLGRASTQTRKNMADRKPDTHILQCYLGSHHSLLNRNKSAQVNSTEWRAIGGTCRPWSMNLTMALFFFRVPRIFVNLP